MANLHDEIAAANKKFMDAFASGDATEVGALYTDDCKIMPTGSDVLTGKDSVAHVFGGVMKMGATQVVVAIDEVGPMGGDPDTAYERSHYTFLDKSGKVFDHGKYVVIWKKIGGIWMLYIDIFNTNTPPTA